MGGKSSGGSYEPPEATPVDNSEIEMMMGGFMEGMTAMMGQAQAATQQALNQQMLMSMEAGTPETVDVPDIDWAAKNEELRNKMKADYSNDTAKRLNTANTILSSPLLDDEDANTTNSILGSG